MPELSLRKIWFTTYLAAFILASAPAFASEPKHGLSAFGDLAYPPDFKNFNYVNPDPPKGGTFSLVGWGGVATFNSDTLSNFTVLTGDVYSAGDPLPPGATWR